MGVVYEALDRELRSVVAVKVLRALSPDALYRFKAEFRALQDLRHPNVVELGELIELDGSWFFTMELVDGEDFLAHVRPRDGALDLRRLREVLAQLAVGVGAIHEAGLVHRDLKPSNIRIDAEGRLVILDFGLVAATVAGNPLSDTVVGTAAYMAPEQAASKPIGPPADWYSFGVLLYEALTGTLPFHGTTLEVLLAKQHQEPPPPEQLVPGLPDDLVALCKQTLAFDPAARPTGAEVVSRLGTGQSQRVARGSVASSTSPFVGREAELERLAEAFRDVAGGRTVTVDVRGESGVGKSALIRQFVWRIGAADDLLLVLNGRCYERETVPYKAFDGVVDSLASHLRRLPRGRAEGLIPQHAALLPRVFPVLGRVGVIADAVAPKQAVESPHELRTRAFEALRELLVRLSRQQPLVVVIDDMQWTDADSLLLLADIIRPPDAPQMLLLLSSRELGAHGTPLPGDVRELALEPLPPSDARELAQLLLRASGGRGSSADNLAAEAGGHPLFLHELVRHSISAVEGTPVARFDDALWARVSRLPEGALPILELVCAAGSPLPEETFAAATDLEPNTFARHVGLLRTAQLIRGHGRSGRESIEPYHDRIREILVERLDEQTRLACHRRIAAALEGTGVVESRPELALRHVLAVGDRQRAARYAELAAVRATNGLAFDRAVELWRIALEVGGSDPDETRRLRVALGDALAAAGRGRAAADCYLTATTGVAPTSRLECLRKAAEQLLSSGYIEPGLDVLGALLRELGTPLPPTSRRAFVSLAWHRLRLRVRGLGWTQRDVREIAESELMRLDTYHAVAHGLSVVDTIRGMDFQARALLLALRTGEPVRVGIALLQEAGFRVAASGTRTSEASRLVDQAREIAERARDPYLTAWLIGIEGVIDYFDGRFDRAREQLIEAERRHRAIPVARWELSSSRIFLTLALKPLGALRELDRLADRYTRDAERRGDRFTGTSIRVLCSWRWLVRDDPATARADLDDTTWAPSESGFHLQHFWKAESRMEIALYAGDSSSHLEALEDELDRYHGSMLSRIRMVRYAELSLRGRLALAAAAAGREPSVHRRLVRAVARKLAAQPGCLAELWAASFRAAVAAQLGDHATAVDELRAAEATAAGCGMALWLASIRHRLGTLIGGDQGRTLVADAERWLRDQGVVRPDRMIRVLMPGYRLRDGARHGE